MTEYEMANIAAMQQNIYTAAMQQNIYTAAMRQSYSTNANVGASLRGTGGIGSDFLPVPGPYQSDSMNRKLAKAKEWLAASKWGKK